MSSMKGRHKKVPLDLSCSTEHQLKQLPASKELLAHYRTKLSTLNREYDELSARVDECRSLFDAESRLQQELVQRNADVSRLQQAISDLQVYVFEEREQALRLFAENDKLKVRQLEDRKKIELLLSLSGANEDEVTFFLTKPSQHKTIVPQHSSIKHKKNVVNKVKDDRGEKIVSQSSNSISKRETCDSEILSLKVQSLEAQLSEQIRLYRDETSALLQDRELVRAERAAERSRNEEHIEKLTAQLRKAQEHVCDLTSSLVQTKRDYRGHEEGWTTERDRLLRNLDVCKEQLGEVFPSGGVVVPGSGLRTARSCGELSVLKEQLSERDRMLSMYQAQCATMEQEVTRLREQAQGSKIQFKDRVQKMAAQVTYLRNKYNELDRRRILEAEGFRSDIRLMRNRLRDLERGFTRVNAKSMALPSSSRSIITNSVSSNTGLVSTARDTVERARQLEQELKHIHNRVMSLESELKITEEDDG